MPQALSYEEPSLKHLLVLVSFIYITNAVRTAADYLFYAGIVAEIVSGIVYGSPLAALLPMDWETTFTALGYLGLVLVIFEGGLSTNLPVLLSILPLSTLCALTGIGLPIAFSFALLNAAFGYRPLEAFAAGAALSSTSLGTTLAALNSVTKSQSGEVSEKASSKLPQSAGSIPMTRPRVSQELEDTNASTPTLPPPQPSLQQSRIGTVLISAAIIDDVIGLVIASLIPALASINSESSDGRNGSLAWTIVRPLLSSFLVAVVGSLVARFVLRPLFWCRSLGERWCAPARPGKPWGCLGLSREGSGWGTEAHADAVKLLLMVATLGAMAAITTFVGTSVLYGAYVAGLILTYISNPHTSARSARSSYDAREEECRREALSFEAAFTRTVGSLQNYLFLPLFFASIGFAIPFLDLWHPTVLWRGIVYSVLMCLAKLAVGLPILLYPAVLASASSLASVLRSLGGATRTHLTSAWHRLLRRHTAGPPAFSRTRPLVPPHAAAAAANNERADEPGPAPQTHAAATSARSSLPAAVFMGVAMVSRGEIGLLIAQLARPTENTSTGSSSGTGSEQAGSDGLLGDEAFLVAIWAILVCTLIGPVSVGLVVRRWGARVTAGIWS
ncbi:hypothetical protein C8Q80DRAFT_1268885 [Daedaleopsis nitida]|nr:hypothetical protein C8Q80DRAFT_1268885 [Daedaleopsis nitida]